ncbi:alpha-acetolactate decarboxylase, partial [Streptococcus pneumoniae]
TFLSDDLTLAGHVMYFVINLGIIDVGAVDQFDERFAVQDRQYLFAKLNVDEIKKYIENEE